MAEPELKFGQPFPAQIAALRIRLQQLVPTAKWDDLWQAEHDRAFMVAGAMKADLLADLAAAVDKSISQGTGIEAFRKDFRQIVETRGWHGWTGEGTKKGEAWRTKTIYRTNVATSYAAGRLAQLRAAGYRYFVYRHGGSAHPRVDHLSWDGLVLPANHPFWDTHLPPNGWGCSCYVLGARSMAQARRLGGDPGLKPPEGWDKIDPKTGAPVGIGKGWAYAPGATTSEQIAAFVAKPIGWPYALANAFMREVPEEVRDDFAHGFRALPSLDDDLRRYARRVTQDEAQAAPQKTLGLATSGQVAEFEQLAGVPMRGILWDFMVDKSAVKHVMARHADAGVELTRGQRALGFADFGRLPWLVDRPDSVERIESKDRDVRRLKFTRVLGDERWVAIFEVRRGRKRLALVSMRVEVAG